MSWRHYLVGSISDDVLLVSEVVITVAYSQMFKYVIEMFLRNPEQKVPLEMIDQYRTGSY